MNDTENDGADNGSEELSERLVALRSEAKGLPRLPGVYLMRNETGDVIYVGKAKDLRARVGTYFSGGDGRVQIDFLLRKVTKLETIVVQTENQAFVLERDLITRYKPRYNIRLKDDKSYLSIRIDPNEQWPRLELVRKANEDGAQYFGPYSFNYELKSLLEIIKRVVPLRTCSNTVFHNRQRPCLEYQIKRCAGPCVLPVDREQYASWVEQAISIIEGRSGALVKQLTAQMEKASEELRFEEAATLRDRIQVLEHAWENQAYVSKMGETWDAFAMYREDSLAAVAVLRVRNGRITESLNYKFSDVVVSDEEVFESTIEQFYEARRDYPDEVLAQSAVSEVEMLSDFLAGSAARPVKVSIPQKGAKYRLIELARLNARQHFSQVYEEEGRTIDLAKELARTLKLKQVPRRIECVDISNLQGSDIVGAIVVFYDGKPDRDNYRKYVISFQEKPDDFAAMHEVVTRRLTRGKEEGNLPDLLIIDGGPGQLSKALEARDNLGLSLEIVSLAKQKLEKRNTRRGDYGAVMEKKPERVFSEGGDLPLILQGDHSVTHFVQRIRDEAHRYVITFHRHKRSKRVIHSILDDIPGVGDERRRRLIKTFGSIAKLAIASPEDIAKAGRMPKSIAEKILQRITTRE